MNETRDRVRIEVDDQHGTGVVYLPDVPAADVQAAARVLDEMGITDAQREQMLPLLVRRHADEEAHERWCERNGMLL